MRGEWRIKAYNRFYSLAAAGIAIFLLLSGCSHASVRTSTGADQAAGKIQIVAAENFYGEVAKAVGGNHVKVTSIISSPNVDPHDFQPTTETAKKVNNARLVIYNGLGYDEWMKKIILASSKGQNAVISVGDGVMGKPNGANEHVWYIPQTMPRLAERLAERLAKIDPQHARDYHHNAASYVRSLRPFLQLMHHLKLSKPRQVIVTAPVYNNLLRALNYKPMGRSFSLAIEEGSDPKPKDIIQMQKDIKKHNAAFLVENIQIQNPVVTRLVQFAQSHHVPVLKVSESLPPGKSYEEWMIDQLKQIQRMRKPD